MPRREQDIQLAEVGHRPPTTSGRLTQLFAATKISRAMIFCLWEVKGLWVGEHSRRVGDGEMEGQGSRWMGFEDWRWWNSFHRRFSEVLIQTEPSGCSLPVLAQALATAGLNGNTVLSMAGGGLMVGFQWLRGQHMSTGGLGWEVKW